MNKTVKMQENMKTIKISFKEKKNKKRGKRKIAKIQENIKQVIKQEIIEK